MIDSESSDLNDDMCKRNVRTDATLVCVKTRKTDCKSKEVTSGAV